MSDSVADKIIAECAIAFSANSEDCNKYLKAVAAVFFEPDLFTGAGMDANAIVTELRKSLDWAQLKTSHVDAIRDAKAGEFVIAGMTSGELNSGNGHLAVVIGDDGQLSGEVLVPICYAGSLNPAARVQRKRVSETFGATFAREKKISYFSRQPQTIPKDATIDRLVDFMRGVRVEPEVAALDEAAFKGKSFAKGPKRLKGRKRR